MVIGITGSTGFIGQAVLRAVPWPDSACLRCLVRDRSPRSGLPPAEWMQGDLMNEADCEEFVDGLDVVLHLAQSNSPATSDRHWPSDFTANIAPSLNLLEALRRRQGRGQCHLIFASSGGAVYGRLGAGRGAFREEDQCNPLSPYGIQKLMIEHYLQKERRPSYVPRALVICPAQLRDLVWTKKLDEFGIKADIISQEELGRKDFDIRRYTKHDIIVVDESHNFRNSGTNRYINLQKLIGTGKRNKKIALLTATPINNTVYDLYHQMLLMARNTPTYYREWGIGNLTSYFQSLDKGNIEITELLMQTMRCNLNLFVLFIIKINFLCIKSIFLIST